MCSFGGGGGPSEAELAAQRAAEQAAEQARISAQNTLAASAQGAAQNVAQSAVIANNQRIRRHFGIDNTMTGAGAEAATNSGLGVGVKSSLGL